MGDIVVGSKWRHKRSACIYEVHLLTNVNSTKDRFPLMVTYFPVGSDELYTCTARSFLMRMTHND